MSEEVSEAKFQYVQKAISLTIQRIWLLGCMYIYTFGIPSILAVLQIYNLFWNCPNTKDLNYDFYKTGGDISAKVKEALSKPLFLCETNYSWISVLTFWFFLSLSALSAFSIFYYRRYKDTVPAI